MAQAERAGKTWSAAQILVQRQNYQSLWRRQYRIVSQAIDQFLDDDCTTLAAALAYYTTFSVAPLLLIAFSIAGVFINREVVQHDIQVKIQGLISPDAAEAVGAIVQKTTERSSTGVIGAWLGVLTLLAGATGAFSQIQTSLNRIWQVKPDAWAGGIRTFLGQRILSLGIVLALVFLLLVSLAVDAALSAFSSLISGFVPGRVIGALSMGIGFLIPLAVIAALFASMFKILPDARIAWRDVWTGAAITAILFMLGKFLIVLYLGHSGITSAYGAAGSFVLVVLWAYYSSMIFLFGAEYTQVWSETHSGPVQPKPGAVRLR